MSGFDNETVYANNWDFRGVQPVLPQVSSTGQLPIGTGASPAILVGKITSPAGTISVGYSSPNITIDLSGGTTAIDSIGTQTGTNPIVPTGAGLVTINGAVVAAGTHPVRSDGTGPNTMAIEVQISQAIASTDATKIGLCNFNSADFTVDANGFVSDIGSGFAWTDVAINTEAAVNNGYFCTASLTLTLPASPAQRDIVACFSVGGATITVTANTGQTIQVGATTSAAAGTAVNTLSGDSLYLVYRSTTTSWKAINYVGAWIVT